MTQEHINILIIDDSVLYHHILTGIITEFTDVKVVGTAVNGQLGLDKMREINPTLILLDMEMPVLNGLKTLEFIRKERPEIGVIMISGVTLGAAEVTIKALELGAFGFIPKPVGTDSHANREDLKRHLYDLLSAFRKRRKKAPPVAENSTLHVDHQETSTTERIQPTPSIIAASTVPKNLEIVVIGVSTGGPNALAAVIPKLPADLGVPILLVQHMPPVFTKSLADSLDKKSNIRVKEASEDDAIQPNFVYIAPGGKHMVIRKVSRLEADGSTRHQYRIGLTDGPPEINCKPSVNVLFRSVASAFSGSVLALVMTGMGADGCEGVKALKRKSCYCLIQDENSCTVYGMPKTVADAQLSDEIIPLDKIADRMTRLIKDTKK